MTERGIAGQGGGSQPTGEKHPHPTEVGAKQAKHKGSPSDLCAHAGHFPSRSSLNHQHRTLLRVALVDGDPYVHGYVRQVFAACANGWVLQSHISPDSALAALGSTAATPSHSPPSVVLLETQFQGLSGQEGARALKALLPRSPVLICTACSDPATIVESLMAGASGYLLKPLVSEHLVWAVSEAAQGRPVLCQEAQAAGMDYIRRAGASGQCARLSWREREVMLLLMNGATTKDVARKLGVEEGTAHWHLDNIYKKLHVHSKVEARRKFAGGG